MPKDFSSLFDTPKQKIENTIAPPKPEPVTEPVPTPTAQVPATPIVQVPATHKPSQKPPIDRLVLEAMNKRFGRKPQNQDISVKKLNRDGKLMF